MVEGKLLMPISVLFKGKLWVSLESPSRSSEGARELRSAAQSRPWDQGIKAPAEGNLAFKLEPTGQRLVQAPDRITSCSSSMGHTH